MLEYIDHIVSIFGGIVMGVIGIYTAYLTLCCKTINIISCKMINYSDREQHIKFIIQAHNKSLSPISISGLYLVFNGTHFIELKKYDEPLILQAHTAASIVGNDIYDPKFDFNNQKIISNPIYLLAITNKGVSISGYHYTNKIKAIYFYIKSLKWRYKKNYKNLIPIEYSSYIDANYTLACVIKNTIEDNAFVSVTVIGSEVPFQQNDAPL